MTPRQLVLLMDRSRLELVHREMVAAYTTAAVINYSQLRPQDGVRLTDFMPNYRDSSAKARPETALDRLSDEELEALSDYNIRVAETAARLRQNYGR